MTSGLLLAENDAGPFPGLLTLMPIVIIFLLYIFMVQRPQRREQESRQRMLANLKKNDRVLTTGGIYGVVTNVQPDAQEVTIRVDETSNTKLRMTLSAIARVLSDETEGSGEKPNP